MEIGRSLSTEGRITFLKKCPACGGNHLKKSRQYFDSHLAICEECRLVFVNPRPTEDWIDSYYAGSPVYGAGITDNGWFGSPQERLMELKMPESFKKYNTAILDDIETYMRPGKILDIGCSIGTLLRFARDRGWTVNGLEAAKDAAAYARNHHGLIVYTSGLSELYSERTSYDCITMIHVLEHLTDFQLYLTEAWHLLKEKGILYIRVPNFSSLKYKLAGQHYFLHVPEHITWFSLNSMHHLLDKHKFKMIANRTCCFSNDPYFYFGIIKRLNIASLLFKLLGYDNKQWKEDDNGTIRNEHNNTKPISKKYSYVDKMTKFLNLFWPKKLVTFSGAGDELVVIAQKNTRQSTDQKNDHS
jgi:2-polyprenyl-3-methyl-5-hydroxy-6-metoxy-1,4-benzoquinol methylase